MRNAGLEEAQARIKTAGININNLRYSDDTTLMAESEEALQSLLMKVKKESEKAGSWKKQESSRKTSALLTMSNPLTVWIIINWKILKEMGLPDHLTCLLRNLYAGHETTVRAGHGTTV